MNTEIIIVASILTIAAYIDWKEHRVPNWLTFSTWLAAVVSYSTVFGWSGLLDCMWGTAAGLATLLIPYALNGMGAGDVKLMAAIGAWVGAKVTLHAFIWIALIGGLMGAWSIYKSRQAKQRLNIAVHAGKNLVRLKSLNHGVGQNAPQKMLLPYGVPIAFGYYAYFIFGRLV